MKTDPGGHRAKPVAGRPGEATRECPPDPRIRERPQTKPPALGRRPSAGPRVRPRPSDRHPDGTRPRSHQTWRGGSVERQRDRARPRRSRGRPLKIILSRVHLVASMLSILQHTSRCVLGWSRAAKVTSAAVAGANAYFAYTSHICGLAMNRRKMLEVDSRTGLQFSGCGQSHTVNWRVRPFVDAVCQQIIVV